ncbi:MAG TPA: glycosyltransferase family 2 protein, partial [Bacteroidales bacterium]|nr:glycosyltransferase family 2 protein [Bacteroidales bacterium]
MHKLSIIVSVFNEEASIPMFYQELKNILQNVDFEYEILFVNDGSTDQSLDKIREIKQQDNQVHLIDFSRNFGHEAAMLAGIDFCTGDAAICMDADLQHPPRSIIEMWTKFQEGFDVINMVRMDRQDGGFFRKITSKAFYSITNKMLNSKLEPNASDFFLISKRVIHLLQNNYRERTRFIRGFIQIIGFNRTTITFHAPERVAGVSKYSFFKLLTLSFSAISTLSKVPLKLGLWSGLLSGLMSIIIAIYSLVMWFIDKPV